MAFLEKAVNKKFINLLHKTLVSFCVYAFKVPYDSEKNKQKNYCQNCLR